MGSGLALRCRAWVGRADIWVGMVGAGLGPLQRHPHGALDTPRRPDLNLSPSTVPSRENWEKVLLQLLLN